MIGVPDTRLCKREAKIEIQNISRKKFLYAGKVKSLKGWYWHLVKKKINPEMGR